MSGERTISDDVEELDAPPPTVAPPTAPTRRMLARLPPLEEMLARASAPTAKEPAVDEAAIEGAPAVVAPAAPRRSLGRLPPAGEPLPRPSAPAASAGPDFVETIASPVAAHREVARRGLGRLEEPSSPAPEARTAAASPALEHEGTVRDLPARPTDTARDPPPAADDAAPEIASAPLPPLATVERPSVAIVDEHATEYCPTCARRVPRAEVQVLTRDGRKTVAVCSVCNGYLKQVPAPSAWVDPKPRAAAAPRAGASPAPAAVTPPAPRPLAWVLVEAIRWPLRLEVLPMLLGLSGLVWLFSSSALLDIPHAADAGRALAIGVLATSAARVIRSTHRPEAGETTTAAVLRHLGALLLGGAPLVAALASDALGVRSPTQQMALVVAGIALFSLYVPAAQILVGSRETVLAALDPIAPIRFALRVGLAYLVPCAILLAVSLAHLVVVAITIRVGVAIFGSSTPAWGALVALFVTAGVLAEARVLGLLVREHPFDL